MRMPVFLSDMLRTVGPIVRFRNTFGPDVFFAAEPLAIEEVLVTKAGSFSKARGTRRLRRLLGNGLLTAERPDHLPHRRLVQPAFHRKRLDEYARVMVASSLGRVAGWRDGNIIDVDRETNRLALEIAASALFGADLHGDMDAISAALDDAMSTFPISMLPFSEVLDHLPVPITRKFQRAKRTLDAIVLRMVREHRREGRDRGDVLSMLLAARDDEQGAMDDAQIRDEAMTILLAGHETTAERAGVDVLSPAAQSRRRSALARASRDGLGWAHADVRRCRATWLRACDFSGSDAPLSAGLDHGRDARRNPLRSAAIRLRGATSLSSRSGSRIAIRVSGPSRSASTRRASQVRRRQRFAYFPFGGGTRICIGEAFAWTEGILAIATIAQRVRLEAGRPRRRRDVAARHAATRARLFGRESACERASHFKAYPFNEGRGLALVARERAFATLDRGAVFHILVIDANVGRASGQGRRRELRRASEIAYEICIVERERARREHRDELRKFSRRKRRFGRLDQRVLDGSRARRLLVGRRFRLMPSPQPRRHRPLQRVGVRPTLVAGVHRPSQRCRRRALRARRIVRCCA